MDIRALISQPVTKELAAFDDAFRFSLQGESRNVQAVMDYILQSNGKRIRPVVVLLSALMSGKVTSVSIESAVLIELLHTASLIHDDVVDETEKRRGEPSVNAVFDNKVAVLSGDYILSVVFYKAVSIGNPSIFSVIGQLGKHLASGELDQLDNVKQFNFSEESYLHVIRKKTAMLFSACTEIGALSADASPEWVDALKLYGENIGMCFQIRDDIFDYYDEAEIGKPTGNDIREGKVTLPLIFALNQASSEEKHRLIQIIREKNFSDENVKLLLSFAKENQGIDYAHKKMQQYADKAKTALSIFPDSEAKSALTDLTGYIMERNK